MGAEMMERDLKKTAYINGILIALNFAYFLYLEIAGSTEDAWFMYTKGAVVASAVLEDGEYFRLFTAMFMHFGIRHLVNNMIVLFALGGHLERALGHFGYLFFYLACGGVSNLVSAMLEAPEAPAVSAGASGAIFGVTGGLLFVVLVNRGRLEDLHTRQLAVMIALSLYMGFASQGVDNAAHVAGLAAGILLAAVLYRRPKDKRERNKGGTENEG